MILLVGDARRTTRRQVNATVDQLRHVNAQIIAASSTTSAAEPGRSASR